MGDGLKRARAAALATRPKRPKPARGEALGILNPWGDLWTYETFKTEADAWAYIERFWRDFSPGAGGDLRRFKIVPVRVTVSALSGSPGLSGAQGEARASSSTQDELLLPKLTKAEAKRLLKETG